jgi:hexosaminidase
MKRSLVLVLIIICAIPGILSTDLITDYKVIPLPDEIHMNEGKAFVLYKKINICFIKENKAMSNNALLLSSYLETATGISASLNKSINSGKYIALRLDASLPHAEGYRIKVNKDSVVIIAGTEAGVFYGIQTLRKSISQKPGKKVLLPPAEITDFPRFSYRGVMLDVARHFTSVGNMKIFIDMMAMHNLNHLHWHLTDDQGWRIEIKKHPKLSQIGSKRSETVIGKNSGKYDGTPYGGYYTQEEIKEIIGYAKDRYITIIPEIDLPGHMLGVLAAYPELGCTGGPYEVWTKWGIADDVLCAGNDANLSLIEDILTEVATLFPAEYVHIGGDECRKTRWKACSKCQAKIQSLGLVSDDHVTAEEKLQSYVIKYAGKILHAQGKKLLGWEEILEGGLSATATIMSWRGKNKEIEAVKNGNKVIMTSKTHLYFDYYQSKQVEKEPFAIGGYVPLENVYAYNPVPDILSEEEQKRIIGVQANVWTEYMPVFSHVQYMVLPRLAALCEVQWMRQDKRQYEDFLKRIRGLTGLYNQCGYNYRNIEF